VVGQFVSRVIWGRPDQFGPFCSMAVLDGDELIAGTVYHNAQPEAGVIELSSAAMSRRWLQPHVIRGMFYMAFDVIGAQLAVLRVSERNTGMVGIARRFGFSETIIPRLRGRDEAEIIFQLTDDAWRAHPLHNRR